MNWLKISACIAACFAFNARAHACEPILPFVKVVGGPVALTNSWVILLVAVVVKSIIFSIMQKQLSIVQGMLLMFIGNVLTTFIGLLAAIMIGSGPVFVVGFFIVWALCLMPAKRLLVAVKHPFLKRFSAGSLAGMMALALVVSCIFFGVSSVFADSNHLVLYWLWKLAAVYIALIVSIALTAFWEEWVVWKLSRSPIDYTGYVQPVVRANLVVLFCVMLFAAAVTLPQRFKSPNFLVKLGLIHNYESEVGTKSPSGAPKNPKNF